MGAQFWSRLAGQSLWVKGVCLIKNQEGYFCKGRKTKLLRITCQNLWRSGHPYFSLWFWYVMEIQVAFSLWWHKTLISIWCIWWVRCGISNNTQKPKLLPYTTLYHIKMKWDVCFSKKIFVQGKPDVRSVANFSFWLPYTFQLKWRLGKKAGT